MFTSVSPSAISNAMSMTRYPLSNILIQMSGAPGSGKSSLARAIQSSMRGVVIDHDVIRSGLLRSSAAQCFDTMAAAAYNLQWDLANDFMKQGHNVIVDSTCNFPQVIEEGTNLAAKHGYTYWYIECHFPDIELLDLRLRNRENPMRSQRTAVDCPPAAAQQSRTGEDPQALFKKWIDTPCRPTTHAITIDSRGDLETQLHEVVTQIMTG